MTDATITKTLDKINNLPSEYSLGFKRLTVLPKRVRKQINLSCILRGENNNNSIKEFLNKLTDQQYIDWLKTQ